MCRSVGITTEYPAVLADSANHLGYVGTASAGKEVWVSQRVIMNYFTAKRLLGALQMTVLRHEGALTRRRKNASGPMRRLARLKAVQA